MPFCAQKNLRRGRMIAFLQKNPQHLFTLARETDSAGGEPLAYVR